MDRPGFSPSEPLLGNLSRFRFFTSLTTEKPFSSTGQERHCRRLNGRVAAILCYRRYIGPLQPISSISGYRREQLFAFGMLCTDRKRGRFSSGLGLALNRYSRKFCAVTADVRTRTFHRGPCDPHTKCHASPGYGGNQVFALSIRFHSGGQRYDSGSNLGYRKP